VVELELKGRNLRNGSRIMLQMFLYYFIGTSFLKQCWQIAMSFANATLKYNNIMKLWQLISK
jgi:hypothetical protein